MLEHKAVNNSNRHRLWWPARLSPAALVVITLITHSGAEAQGTANRRPARQKTVGELLKNIEKKAKKVDIQKQKSALPQFNALGKSRNNLTAVQPPSRSTLYYKEGTDESELERITDAGISQLYKLTRQFKNSSRRGELWLRLAELYVEKARLIEYQMQSDYDNKLAAFQSGKTKAKPRLNLRPAHEYNKKAIQLYEWFLRDFPKDDKVDQALFFLGYNYFELGDQSRGQAYYTRLTREFPKSPYVDESNFALGEFYFENEKWKEALGHYQKVARNRRARLYSFALYKSAWCFYKTEQVRQALASLERVIRVGRVAKGQDTQSAGGVSRIRLATEAIKDLVIFYAEVGSPEGAKGYFAKVAGNKATFGLLEKLAYYYADTGNRNGARYVFKDLIETRPNAPKAYDYQYQIVTMYASAGNDKVFRQELYSWIENYGPQSVWARSNAKNKELVAKANQLIETTLRNYILQQHQTAQNSRAPFSQKLAQSGYELYFNTFKESPRLDEMHFFYAELLFEMKDYERAAYHYLWVSSNAPKSKYFEKSILNAILALEKKLPSEQEIKKIVGDTKEPVEFDRTIRAFEKTADRYFKTFPNGESTVAIKYKVGSLHYYYNHFDQALAIFNDIVKNHPKTKEAEYSANLILDIYNIKKDYKGLEQAGAEILAVPEMAKSSVGGQVKDIMQRSAFARAQQLEKDKEYAKAAASFEDFTQKHPRSELAQASYYNAGINYERANDLAKAIAMYEVVANTKGGNAGLAKNSSKYLAGLYEKTGQYEKAAGAFETYAARNPKDAEAIDFWYNAAVIRDGMEFYTAALRNYQKYYDMSRKPDRVEVLFLMGRVWEKRRNYRRAVSYYNQYMEANPSNASGVVEASFKIAKLNDAMGRNRTAREWYEKTVAIQRRLASRGDAVGVPFAAESKFKLVYSTYEELRKIRIPGSPQAQAKAVQQKLGLINKLKNDLAAVIKYDDGYMVVAALTTMGQAYQHMSASLYNAPLPKGLDADGIKQYKAEVEKIARPFQENAIENYQSAIEKGFRMESYNEWLKVAMKELNNLKPDVYVDHGERVIITKVPDWMDI